MDPQLAMGLYVVVVFLVNLTWLGTIAGEVSYQQPELYGRLSGHPVSFEPTVIKAQAKWLWFLYSGQYKKQIQNEGIRKACTWFIIWFSITTFPIVIVMLGSFVVFWL